MESLKRKVCRDLYEEIDRLERSVIEPEEQIIELKAQIRTKTEEVNSLAIENENLRYKLSRIQKSYEQLIEAIKKIKLPIVIINEEDEK
jgi:regulator of replication initiation timing